MDACFLDDGKSNLVISGCPPEGQRKGEGIDAVSLLKDELVSTVLSVFSGEMMLGAKRDSPAIVGLLTEADGAFAITLGGSAFELCLFPGRGCLRSARQDRGFAEIRMIGEGESAA